MFEEFGELSFDLKKLDEGNGIFHTLTTRNAGYHKSCYIQFNNTKLKRSEKYFKTHGRKRHHEEITPAVTTERAGPSSPKKLRSSSTIHFPNKEICCICGEPKSDNKPLHATAAPAHNKFDKKKDRENVLTKTKQWREMATVLRHTRLLSLIGSSKLPKGDLRSEGLFLS